MVTLTDRPTVPWTYLATKITVGERHVSVDALVNLKKNTTSCQQLLYFDFVPAALCSTHDLPRKSEAHCSTMRHAKIIVVTANIQISLRVLSVESQASFLYYVRSGYRHSATLSFVYYKVHLCIMRRQTQTDH